MDSQLRTIQLQTCCLVFSDFVNVMLQLALPLLISCLGFLQFTDGGSWSSADSNTAGQEKKPVQIFNNRQKKKFCLISHSLSLILIQILYSWIYDRLVRQNGGRGELHKLSKMERSCIDFSRAGAKIGCHGLQQENWEVWDEVEGWAVWDCGKWNSCSYKSLLWTSKVSTEKKKDFRVSIVTSFTQWKLFCWCWSDILFFRILAKVLLFFQSWFFKKTDSLWKGREWRQTCQTCCLVLPRIH